MRTGRERDTFNKEFRKIGNAKKERQLSLEDRVQCFGRLKLYHYKNKQVGSNH